MHAHSVYLSGLHFSLREVMNLQCQCGYRCLSEMENSLTRTQFHFPCDVPFQFHRLRPPQQTRVIDNKRFSSTIFLSDHLGVQIISVFCACGLDLFLWLNFTCREDWPQEEDSVGLEGKLSDEQLNCVPHKLTQNTLTSETRSFAAKKSAMNQPARHRGGSLC